MAKFLGEAGLTALWGKIGSTFIKKDSGTAASPEVVSGVKQFTNGLVLNSGSSWTSSDRAIPFSANGSPQLIQYSDTTLTFNPSTKVLKVDGNEVLHAGNISSASFADSIPTQGSSRLITSGGMYSVLEELEDTVAASENSLNNRVTVLENTSLTTNSLTNHAKFADTSTADQVLVSKSGGYEWKTLGSNAYNSTAFLTTHQDWNLVASTSSGTSNATTATTNTTTYLNLIKDSTFDSGVQITGTQNVSVSAVSGTLTITGPNLSSYVTGSGLTADKIVLGNGNSTVKTSSKGITTTAPSSSSDDTTVPTSKAVNSAISTALGTVAGALKYKGTVASNSALPANHSVGDVYVVSVAGTFVGKACEVGDYIVCKTAGTSANNAHWDVLNGENQVDNKSASLAAAGSSATIATVDGTNITVTTPSGWTGVDKTGTITGITMNSTSMGTSGVVDLGNVAAPNDVMWEAGTGTGAIKTKGSSGTAGGNYSTVEGKGSVTGGTHTTYDLTPDTADSSAGSYAHAEGRYTIASGARGSHAEGDRTLSGGQASHAEGRETIASGGSSHAEGSNTIASGGSSHAEGGNTTASGSSSHAEGSGTNANASHSHAEGSDTTASGNGSHAEGQGTIASGNGSHAEGVGYNDIYTTAGADSAHAEGAGVVVKGQAAHGEGLLNVAGRTQEEAVAALADFHNLSGTTEQKVSKLIGFASHSEGSSTRALGTSSHAEGNSTQALVNATHAEGDSTTASGEAAHSEGCNTTASGNQAHAEGYHTEATANQAHAEGKYTEATSENAHAEGNHTTANGNASHTEGYYTVANNNVEHAEGQYNVSHKASTTFGNAGNTIHSVGIGTSNARKNAFEIMQNGDMYIYGVGGYTGSNISTASTLQTILSSSSPVAITNSEIDTILAS